MLDHATVLIMRLARNHPLPGGNKRVSLALTILFLERNGSQWGEPQHDRDGVMVERIAGVAATHDEIKEWIQDRTS